MAAVTSVASLGALFAELTVVSPSQASREQHYEALNTLWKGSPNTPKDLTAALRYAETVVMPHSKDIAHLVSAYIEQELADSSQGEEQSCHFQKLAKHLEHIDRTHLPEDYLPGYDHLMCHRFDRALRYQDAETHFVEQLPLDTEKRVLKGPESSIDKVVHLLLPHFANLAHPQQVTKRNFQLLDTQECAVLILCYDLPEIALEEAQTVAAHKGTNPYVHYNLGKMLAIHNRFTEALQEMSRAVQLLEDSTQPPSLEQERQLRSWKRACKAIKGCISDSRTRSLRVMNHIMHYHADAALHGDDDDTLFQSLTQVQVPLSLKWSTKYVLPYFSTRDVEYRLADIAQKYRSTVYLELLFAQVRLQFPQYNPHLRQDLRAALIHTKRAIELEPLPAAHHLLATILYTCAAKTQLACCKRFCNEAAERHIAFYVQPSSK